MAFKVGDVVMLKSGGAVMTVVQALNGGAVTCNWHNCMGAEHFMHAERTYPEEAVELLSDVKAREQAEADKIDRGIDAAQREY